MSDIVFPQAGDAPDAALFAALAARGTSGIVSGLSLNVDFSISEVTVQPGVAVIATGPETTQHPNIQPAETVQATTKVVDLDSTTVGLTANAVNSVFVDANLNANDDPKVVTNTTASRPSSGVKIGEVDAGSNTVSEGWNRIADDGTLTFPDEQSADDQSALLQEGTILYARDDDSHFFVV
jgi:hypothetical protein